VENSELFGFPAPLPAPGYNPTHGGVFIVSKAPPGIPYFAASPRFTETKNRGGQPAIAFADAQGLSFDGDIAIDVGGMTDAMTDNIMWPVITRARNNIFLVISPQMSSPRMLVSPSYGCSRILSAILAVSARQQTAMVVTAADPDRIIARAVASHLARSLAPAAVQQIGLAPAAPQVAGIAPPLTQFSLNPPQQFRGMFATPAVSRATWERINRPQPVPHAQSSFGIRSQLAQVLPEVNRHTAVAYMTRHFYPVANDTELGAHASFDVPPDAIVPDIGPDPADLHMDTPSAEARERPAPGYAEVTNQFREGGAEGAPRHQRSDATTTRLSELKRLRLGHTDGKLSSSQRGRLRELQDGFRKFFKVRSRQFQPALFEKALTTALQSWCSGKTLRDIQRSIDDSPVDWDPHTTRMFLKSQTVKKRPAQYGPAKAGQIVATFSKSLIFRDAVWAAYVGEVIEDMRLPSTFLHNRPISFMMSWFRKWWTPGAAATASDYTAWDSGCDEVFAHFDAWLLHTVGVPDWYICDYLDLKFNTSCYKGELLPMQFSGDRWTWLFNTTRNAALTGAAFNIPVGTPACFSGDDMILLGDYGFRPGFRPGSWLMVPKILRGTDLDFCGFSFAGQRPAVDSDALLLRATLGLQQGRGDASYWDSLDLACRFGDPHRPDSKLASAIQLTADARALYSLPPSKFPNYSSR